MNLVGILIGYCIAIRYRRRIAAVCTFVELKTVCSRRCLNRLIFYRLTGSSIIRCKCHSCSKMNLTVSILNRILTATLENVMPLAGIHRHSRCYHPAGTGTGHDRILAVRCQNSSCTDIQRYNIRCPHIPDQLLTDLTVYDCRPRKIAVSGFRSDPGVSSVYRYLNLLDLKCIHSGICVFRRIAVKFLVCDPIFNIERDHGR